MEGSADGFEVENNGYYNHVVCKKFFTVIDFSLNLPMNIASGKQ